MTDEEKRVHDAFLAIEVPETLNEKTLRFIEAHRETTEQVGATQQPQVEVSVTKGADQGSTKPALKARRGGRFKVVAALVACFCLAFAGMGGYAYATPSAYVSVESPVDVALRVNRFDIVVGVESFDGSELSGDQYPIDVLGKSYTEALSEIAQFSKTVAASAGVESSEAFDISITSNNQEQAQNLRQESEHCMSAHGMHGHCHSVTPEQRQEAADAGMGVARYLAAQELLTLDPSLTMEDCRGMSMAELRERIVDLGGEVPAMDSGVGCGADDGEGCANGRGAGRGHGGGHGKGNGAGGHGMHGAS